MADSSSLTLSTSTSNPSVIPPINRISPEILSEIFMECLSQAFDREVGIPHRRRRHIGKVVANCLSQVNRWFRDVTVEATHGLWAGIELSMLSSQGSHPSGMETLLNRSGSSGLSVRLDGSFTITGPEEQQSLALVLGTSSRWQRLAVNFSGDGIMAREFAAIASTVPGTPPRFPRLEHLEIGPAISLDLQNWFEVSSPNLRSVTMWDGFRGFALPERPSLILPYAQLTRFQVSMTVAHCLSFLDKIPSLLTFVGMLLGSVEARGPQSPTTHNLRNLGISCGKLTSWTNADGFFQSLTMPMLSGIWLGTPGGSPAEWGDAICISFTSFLTRSSCQLHTFSFSNMTISAQALTRILSAMDSLVHLQLGGSFSTANNAVLSLLTPTASSKTAVICPRLQQLTILSPWFFHNQTLISLVNARSGSSSVAQLRSLSLLAQSGERADAMQSNALVVSQIKELKDRLMVSQPQLELYFFASAVMVPGDKCKVAYNHV